MFKVDKKNFLIIGAIVETLSLILLIIGFALILGYKMNITNIITYMVFSTLAGGIAAALVFFRLKVWFFIYIIGLAVGFFEMYRSFFDAMSGWGDLVGVISLLIWPAMGLGVGLLVQLAIYLYRRLKK